MTVYRPAGRRSFRYDFEYEGHRYLGNTKQLTKQDAELAEGALKLKLRREGAQIGMPAMSPTFTTWATTYYNHVLLREKPKSPESIFHELRVVLRFWGATPKGDNPKNPAIEGEPYHNLRLRDAIDDPAWLLKFEDWMEARGVAGGTRNHYRSRVSRMYSVAMHPSYRKATGITVNPFLGIPRDRTSGRTVTLTRQQVLAWLKAMSYHTGLAVAIAALAPMLRLDNILSLKWDEHVDPQFRYLTVPKHKTERSTGAPLVTPVSQQLKRILLDAKRRKTSAYVVSYRGSQVHTVRAGLINAAKRAGIVYGRATADGATFHTLRHTASTILAELEVNPWLHQKALGHLALATTQKYTHLRPTSLKPVVEQLSRALPIEAAVIGLRRRAAGEAAGLPKTARAKR